MSWIKEINYADADPQLRKLFDSAEGQRNSPDNIIKVHSLRPHTLSGHLSLYKNVLHHSANTLPKWYLETIGVYVSLLNNCAYCVTHHIEGLKKNSAQENDAAKIIECLQQGKPENFFSGFFLEGLMYVKILTQSPATINEEHIHKLRHAGFSDGEILEINQVCAYFNYANRTVLGLGVELKGDILGFSPNDAGE
jgi:uncharacterized peroxidase-related enzyme